MMILQLLQDPALTTAKDVAQWGLGAILLAVLFFAVRTIQQITDKGADRAVDAQKNCDLHNAAMVDSFTSTVCKMDEARSRQQEALTTTMLNTVRESREASERREDRLHETLRDLRGLPPVKN